MFNYLYCFESMLAPIYFAEDWETVGRRTSGYKENNKISFTTYSESYPAGSQFITSSRTPYLYFNQIHKTPPLEQVGMCLHQTSN
jgi:hypothetical protein